MIIFYKIIEVWCKYPFQQEIDYRYCEFSYSKKTFRKIKGLKLRSDTSIHEKETYLKKELNLKKLTVQKVK